MSDKYEIDIQDFVKALQSGQDLNGKDGLLTPLIKQVTKAALAAEIDEHLAQGNQPNRKNGVSQKIIQTVSSSFELDTPSDRNGSFEPQTVKKYQTQLTDEMERNIISLFALGNSYKSIREYLLEMYGTEVSNGTVNAVTDRLVPELRALQERELDAVYPFVWLDANHYKIKENGRFISKAL